MNTETIDPAFPHLNSVARKLLDGTDAERIKAIQMGSWIPYGRARQVLEQLEELIDHPRVIRMPHMLLVGPTNNGKTHILRRFVENHPRDANRQGDAAIIPAVFVDAPPTPERGELYNRILSAVGVPRRNGSTIPEREHQIYKILPALQTKVLIIDEIQHLIAGGMIKQRDFRNAIKNLGNELQISIVAAGVEDAFHAFASDPQLSNRFVPIPLPRWKLDEEFVSLVKTFEKRTPLRDPSSLASNEMLIKLHGMCDGLIGELHAIVKKAAIKAIRTGKERISIALLNDIGWVPPTQRGDRRAYSL